MAGGGRDPGRSVTSRVLAVLGAFDADHRHLSLSEVSRRACLPVATAARLLSELPEGRQVPMESLPPRPLWNTWPVLAALIALLIAEWLLRKLAGMA